MKVNLLRIIKKKVDQESGLDHTRSMFTRVVPTWQERREFLREIDAKYNDMARRALSAQWSESGLVISVGGTNRVEWKEGSATNEKSGGPRVRVCDRECGC
jgi:hypothetical protein